MLEEGCLANLLVPGSECSLHQALDRSKGPLIAALFHGGGGGPDRIHREHCPRPGVRKTRPRVGISPLPDRALLASERAPFELPDPGLYVGQPASFAFPWMDGRS